MVGQLTHYQVAVLLSAFRRTYRRVHGSGWTLTEDGVTAACWLDTALGRKRAEHPKVLAALVRLGVVLATDAA